MCSRIEGPREDGRASTCPQGLCVSLARNSFISPAQTHLPEALLCIRAFPTGLFQQSGFAVGSFLNNPGKQGKEEKNGREGKEEWERNVPSEDRAGDGVGAKSGEGEDLERVQRVGSR